MWPEGVLLRLGSAPTACPALCTFVSPGAEPHLVGELQLQARAPGEARRAGSCAGARAPRMVSPLAIDQSPAVPIGLCRRLVTADYVTLADFTSQGSRTADWGFA